MSAGNVIAINGSYTIRKINSNGDTITIDSHDSSLDVLSVSYQGYSYMVHVDDNLATNENFNNFSIVDQVSSDLSSFNMVLRLRAEIDGIKCLLVADAPIQPENIFENIIDIGQITFTYDSSLIQEDLDNDGSFDNLGCTNPLAINYESCALFDDGSCEYPTFLGSDAFAQKGCNDSRACTCDNPICDCDYCGTQFEFVCNMSKDESIIVQTDAIVGDEFMEVEVYGKGFRNVMSDGTTNQTQNCQYPIYPVDIGFTQKYLNWNDIDVEDGQPWNFENSSIYEGYYRDLENRETSQNAPTLAIEIRCNSSNIKKFSFKLNKIQLYEKFTTSGFSNDYLSLFESLEINNNNDTTPSIVSVDGILRNKIQAGDKIILNLPIENLITLNINFSDITFFNEDNEIINYNLDSSKTHDYIQNWNYEIYSNIILNNKRLCAESPNTDNLIWPTEDINPNSPGVEFNQENVWQYYCDIGERNVSDILRLFSFFHLLGGKTQVQEIELHRGLNRISPIVTPTGFAYHYGNSLAGSDIIRNTESKYYGWELDMTGAAGDVARYDAVWLSRKYPWIRKIYTYGDQGSNSLPAQIENNCNGGICESVWDGGELGNDNDLSFRRIIASASYNVDICTNYVDESGNPDVDAYYCFEGNKCVLEETGELAYYWNEGQSINSDHFSYPHMCKEDSDCYESTHYSGYEEAGAHAEAQGYENVFWDSVNNRPKVKCENSNAVSVSGVCQGGFWDGKPSILVNIPIQGHPTITSRTFLWCPGSSENLFELDLFGVLVGAYQTGMSAFPYLERTTDPYYSSYAIPVWAEDVVVGEVAGLDAVDISFPCQCKDHLYESFSTIKSFSENSVPSSATGYLNNPGIEGYIGRLIDIIEYETELITHVDTNEDDIYDTWLGTLTQLKPGRGYRFKTSKPAEEGTTAWHGDNQHVYLHYDGYYDISGICTGGSSTHERNSRVDENSTIVRVCKASEELSNCNSNPSNDNLFENICYGGIYNNRNLELHDDKLTCLGQYCDKPYDVITWYSDMDKNLNIIQPSSGRTFNLTKKLCSNLDEPYTFLVCPDDNKEYFKYDPILGYELETEMTNMISDFNSLFDDYIPGHTSSTDRNELICSQNCSQDCVEVNYFKENYNDCVGVVDCNGNCFSELQLINPNEENYAYDFNYFSRYDKYGVCCLQGNIDQCGVCNGNNTSCSTDCPFEAIFAQVNFDVVAFTQITPSDPPELPYEDYNLNYGTISLQIQSPENYIQEVEFEIFSNVVGANVNSPDFNISSNYDSNQDTTKIIIQSLNEGVTFLPNQLIEINLTLNNFYPNDISSFIEDGFNICLDYSSIKVYTLGDNILEVTTSADTSEGKICTSQIDNFSGVNYYGCSDDSSFNYDTNCETLIPYEESENTGLVHCSDIYCQFTDQDCAGVPGGDSFLDHCGVCITPYNESIGPGSICPGQMYFSSEENPICDAGPGNCNWEESNSAFGCDCVCFSGAELDCAGVCQGPNLESYIPEGSPSAGQAQCCTGLLPGQPDDGTIPDGDVEFICPPGFYYWPNGPFDEWAPDPQCFPIGDLNASGHIDIGDIITLVDYILNDDYCENNPNYPMCTGQG